MGGIQPSEYRLPAETRIGRVRLAVSDLQKSLDFYTRVIGLTVKSGIETAEPSLARLGVEGEDQVLLELQALPGTQAIGQQKRLGLYHAAYLLPSREALSRFIEHLNAQSVPFGASDHLYSEALYLTDPDGFAVEVYADRPREEWRFEGEELLSGVFPLRLSELPRVAPGSWKGVPQGTTVGHVHFFVGDLEKAKTFYHRGLGLDLMTWRYSGALFASAGGYHHHVGLNIWAAGSPPAIETEPRLLFWELVLPDPDDIDEVLLSLQREGHSRAHSDTNITSVTDPWGIGVHLVSAPTTGRSDSGQNGILREER
jgi:catechol 2,3-dioxygenase